MNRLQQTLTQCFRILTITFLAGTYVLANTPEKNNNSTTPSGFVHQKWSELNGLFSAQYRGSSASSLLSKSSPSLFSEKMESGTWASFNCPSGILSNPDFETDFVGWSFFNNSNIVTDAHTGNKAAQTSGSAAGGVGQNLIAYEGQVYSLEVYAKQNAVGGAVVGVKFFDKEWNELAAYHQEVISSTYQQYLVSGKAPAGTAYVQAVGWKHAGTGTANFDAFCMENWNINVPVCSGLKCEISPSWGNYVWAMEDGGEWKDYDDGGLFLCDNGDGTLSLVGNIINAHDAEWDAGTATPCGSQDGWEINLLLSDRQTWAEFGGSWVQNNGCGDNRFDWDYWDLSGVLTGTGCNAGRTITVNSPAGGYRLQVGWGGNSQSCDFGMSTWMHATENGSPVSADLYMHVDATCYFDTRPEDCSDGVDNDFDGLIDCYDSDCGPQLLVNESFEDVGATVFNTTFEGSPAFALPDGSTLLSGWTMDYGCGGSCTDSYWIDDTADDVNNPKGDYFLWMPGSSYCARQSLSVQLEKCYEVTMTVASWSVPSPQLSTNIAIEAYGGGIDDGNGGLLVIHQEELPASPNWNNLLWKTITFTWTPGVTANTSFYISQKNTTTTARGLAIDEILVKEICCAGGGNPAEIVCEDGRDVEYNFVGINNDVPKTLPLATVSNMDSVVVEVVYKGGNPGSSIDVEDDAGNLYPASRQAVGSNAAVYRVTLPPTSSVTYSNTSSQGSAQSLAAFIYRNNQPGKTVVTEFTTLGGYNGTFSFDIDLPQDVKSRNLRLVLPISEVTYDNRSLDFNVTAGSVSAFETRTWGPGNEGFPNGCCMDTIEFYLENVAPETDLVTVDIISPSSGGQSFVVAATMAVEIFCEEICGNGVDDDGDGYVDNEDQDCLCPDITTPQETDLEICEGTDITFEVHSNAPNPPYSYIEFYRFDSPQANPYTSGDAKVWLGEFANVNNGTGFFTSGNFPNGTASDEVYYVYGCVKPEPQDPETCFPLVEYIVTVNPAPIADAGDGAAICSGISHNLKGSASGGVGSFEYSWDNGLGSGANQTVTPSSTTTYTLTVAGGNQCSSTDEVTITVNPSPSVDAGDDDSICLPDATTLTATGTGAVSPFTFQWSHGLGNGDTKVVSPSTTTIYSVTLTSGNGCNDIDQVTVNVSNCIENCTDGVDNDGDGDIDCFDADCRPEAFAGNDISICLGTSTTLEASVINGNGSYTYVWDNGLGGGATHVVTPSVTTTYTVSITNAVGCEGTAQVTITVNNCPENCTDGVDNDGDGLVDCDDPDCIATAAPQLVDDYFTTCPALPLTDRVTYNDGNLQDPIFSITDYPNSGTVSIDGTGKFTYTPLTTECGSDQFTYQVCNQASGCCATAVAYITIGDTDPPIMFNLPADLTISCDELVPDPTQVLAFDACPGIYIDFEEVTQEYAFGACETYTITRTWVAEDLCGNTSSGSQVITVEDLEAPEIFKIHTLSNGKRVVAGISNRSSNNWKYQKFPITFDEAPLIFSQAVSNNDPSAVVVQHRHVSTQGFEMKLAEQEAADQLHGMEQVAWMAIEPGSVPGLLDAGSFASANDQLQTLSFGQNFVGSPLFLAAAQTVNETDPFSVRWENLTGTSADVFLQEETSKDAETAHTQESLAYLAFEQGGSFVDEDGHEFGETGTLSLTNAWASVSFSGQYLKPAVIFGGVSGSDGSPVTIRVRNVTDTGFEVRLQEWDAQDGAHSPETVTYMVVEGSLPANSPNYCDPEGIDFQFGVNVFIIDNCDDQIAVNYSENAVLQSDGLDITRIWTGIDDCGNPIVYSRQDNCTVAALRVRTLLYGAMMNNGGGNLMRDNLRSLGLLPSIEPYTGLGGFAHQGRGGDEAVSPARFNLTGDDAIVDWVFVEVRDPDFPELVLATRSVLLQRDGDVENIDGGDVIYFPELLEGRYFVTIRHRNHLGLTTENAWTLSSVNIPTVDFRDLTVDVEGNTSGGVLAGSQRTQWAGDFNGDRKVIYQGPHNDIFYLFSRVLADPGNTQYLANFISTGYDRHDYNMDGNIIYQGPNNERSKVLFYTILAHKNNQAYLANYIVSEQLP